MLRRLVNVAELSHQRRCIHASALLLAPKKKKSQTPDQAAAEKATQQAMRQAEELMERRREEEEDHILNSRTRLGKPLPPNVRWLPSNYRITRIPSETKVHEAELAKEQELSPVNEYAIEVINRNPRNLEQLFFDLKPLGYELDENQRRYWNKLTFEKMGRYLIGKVIHYSGRTVVSASTSEPPIFNHLKSSSDIIAAKTIGMILARRCLEAGILWVDCQPVNGAISVETESEKERAFLTSFKENGVQLEEPPQIYPRRHRDL